MALAAGGIPEGWGRIALAEVDSTNAEAMRQAASGVRGPLWITAGQQTAGKGRAGRVWSSPPGNVSSTLLFEVNGPVSVLPQLSFVAGIAGCDAIRSALPAGVLANVRLKWPNDILVDGAKVAGILVEGTVLGGAVLAMIGTGINVAHAPAVAGRTVVALADVGGVGDAGAVADRLCSELAIWVDRWRNGDGFELIRREWLNRALPVGEPVTVHAGAERVGGRFAGLAADGGMLLDVEGGGRRKFAFGDVALGAGKV